MTRLASLCVLALLLTAGCGRKKATPEAVYRQFHRSLTKYARDRHPTYRNQAYALLSKESKDRFEARAKAVNATLPEGVAKLQASQLLRVRHLRFNSEIDKIEALEPSGDEIELDVTVADEVKRVKLVREAEGWRIVLFAPLDPSE